MLTCAVLALHLHHQTRLWHRSDILTCICLSCLFTYTGNCSLTLTCEFERNKCTTTTTSNNNHNNFMMMMMMISYFIIIVLIQIQLRLFLLFIIIIIIIIIISHCSIYNNNKKNDNNNNSFPLKKLIIHHFFSIKRIVPSQRGTKTLSQTFTLTVPSWWNDLLNSIPAAEPLTIFKNQLQTHLFHLYLTLQL